MKMETTAPATWHAARQVLLRIKYLIVSEEPTDHDDYCFDDTLISIAKQFGIEEKIHSGAQPRADIFDRPVVRFGSDTRRWNCTTFRSAIHAVSELSFGSTLVRHIEPIDDIQMANNIASSACAKRGQSYGHTWTWEDTKDEEVPESRCHSLSILGIGFPNLCGQDTTV